ncbi:class I SAM-dependent methyltransferase [Aeromonas enteropelogenes]|uniref:class I SAM-dependent methyltransferase n=1 Tax=Aeromonas enteropelogenes TaxID=29489 RepID=UPI003BA1D6EA
MGKNLDIFGKALRDHYLNQGNEMLQINIEGQESYRLPLSIFFRPADYYAIDRLALSLCSGRILDIGAGAGEHSLFLQKHRRDVTALDISPLACEVMRWRGVNRVINADIFSARFDAEFDTWLLLGRSIGAVGSLPMLSCFLSLAHQYLSANGRLILNSTNGTTNLTTIRKLSFAYNGETDETVSWLDIDQETLRHQGEIYGFSTEILHKEDDGNYLAILKKQP